MPAVLWSLLQICGSTWSHVGSLTSRAGRDHRLVPLRCVCVCVSCLCALTLQMSCVCSPQVREILGRCSCPAQFPMIKVSEGKYKVGDSSALIFIRVSCHCQKPSHQRELAFTMLHDWVCATSYFYRLMSLPHPKIAAPCFLSENIRFNQFCIINKQSNWTFCVNIGSGNHIIVISFLNAEI